MSIRTIKTPLTREDAHTLHCGESVLLSGVVFTARDAAHIRLLEAINKGEQLPFSLENAIVYYVGPTPAKPGCVIGSAGPTTSGRMDAFAPALIALGMTGMIGKGVRSYDVVTAMQEHGAVYLGALGGAGALIARCVISSEVVAYEDLGAEAIRRLTVKDMPLTVVIDCEGNDLYKKGREDYSQWARTGAGKVLRNEL